MKHDEQDLIDAFVALRQHKGLSQSDLAKLAKVPQPSIARMKSRKTSPQINTLSHLQDAMGYRLEIVPQPSDLSEEPNGSILAAIRELEAMKNGEIPKQVITVDELFSS